MYTLRFCCKHGGRYQNTCRRISFRKLPVYQKYLQVFIAGRCTKGTQCRFAHKQKRSYNSSSQNTQTCRNGQDCVYFYRGICKFSHGRTENQTFRNNQSYTRYNNQNSRRWCRYLEDCFRVPNCAFKHYEEDFSELQSTNNPPIAMGAWSWENY